MREKLLVKVFDDIVFNSEKYRRTLEWTGFNVGAKNVPKAYTGMIIERIAVGLHEQAVGNWHYYVTDKGEIFVINTLEYSKNRGRDKRSLRINLIVEVGRAELERALRCGTEGEVDLYRYEAKILVRKKWWER